MINEAQAIELARKTAEDENWAWVDPAQTTLRKSWSGKPVRWEVFSNAAALGAKVRVVIDTQTGEVLEKGYVPR